MGNQTNTINNVERLHGKAKNAVNRGFLESFVVNQGSDRLNFIEQMRPRKLGLIEDKAGSAHAPRIVKAVKVVTEAKRKGSIEVSPSSVKSYQSTNERNNHGDFK